MSVTPKNFHIARFIWAYVSKYPHSTAAQITGAQTQYTRAEIGQALGDLVAADYIRGEDMGREGDRRIIGYYAKVPFVVRAPSWEGVL